MVLNNEKNTVTMITKEGKGKKETERERERGRDICRAGAKHIRLLFMLWALWGLWVPLYSCQLLLCLSHRADCSCSCNLYSCTICRLVAVVEIWISIGLFVSFEFWIFLKNCEY